MTAPTMKKPDPALIFLQADGFSRAYNMLADQRHLSPSEAATIGYPQIVISAFAIELYLKCLICIETGKAPRGHHLKQLFDRLSPETRRRICAIWDGEVKTRRASLWDAMEASSPTATGPVPRALPEALACGNKAFEKVRYIYEGNNADVIFILTDLPTVLRRVIVDKRPELRNIRRKVQVSGQIESATACSSSSSLSSSGSPPTDLG